MLKRILTVVVPAALATGLLVAPATPAGARPHAEKSSDLNLYERRDGRGDRLRVDAERGRVRLNEAFTARSARNASGFVVFLHDRRDCKGAAEERLDPGQRRTGDFDEAVKVRCVEFERSRR